MKAFHNNPSIKEKYITRLQAHYQADEIIKGQYWQNGKGCAVGCTIHSSYHKNYESELGIPKNIAYLQDRIFEGLPNELAKEFPLQFLSSIKVSADLKNVSKLFMIWLLTDSKYGVIKYADNKKVIQDVADAFSRDMVNTVSVEEWKELRKNANDAAGTTTSANSASYAAYTAASYAASTSYYAASTVFSVAATAAYYAAYTAAYFVENTKSEYYIAASNKLIELLKNSN